MARLSLATRKIARRKKYLAMFSFWLSVMHLVNWFWLIVAILIDHQVKSKILKSTYEYDFFERRKYMHKAVYASDDVCINTSY